MDKQDGRTLPAEALRERRKAIIRMWKADKSVREIMAATGACYSTVYGTWNKFQVQGVEAYNVNTKGSKKGQGRNLSADQESSIRKTMIEHMPDHLEQLGLGSALWTRKIVHQLIIRQYQVEMPIRTVGEYLARWHLMPQKPCVPRGHPATVEAQAWLEQSYPAIRDQARAEGGTIFWGEETDIQVLSQGSRSGDKVRSTNRAEQGHSILAGTTVQGSNPRILSATTNQGKIYWMVTDAPVNVEHKLDFLKRLVRDSERKPYLILESMSIAPCALFDSWLPEHASEIRIFPMPARSAARHAQPYFNGGYRGVCD